jgi:hypothetical protein
VKKLFGLILAAFMGAALVSAPMGCNKDDKPKPAADSTKDKDKTPAKDADKAKDK